MPIYKRKRSSYGKNKRRLRPRRTRLVSRKRMRRSPVSINRNPVRYSKEVSVGNITVASGTNSITTAYFFTLAGWLTNSSEFTNLFDQYRLRCVIMKFRLIPPPEANNTPTTLQFYPDIVATVDHDDANVPTDLDTIRQYGKCKSGILKPNSWFTYRCFPTTSMQMYRTATTTGYAPVKNSQWIDLAYTDIPYYSVKVGIDYTSLGTLAANAGVEVRAYLTWEFKNAR